jgi:regulator of nonsense transcripts 1
VAGKTAKVSAHRSLGKGEIRSIETVGKEPQTAAEAWKALIMLGALQQTISLSAHPFINAMWFPTGKAKKKMLWKDTPMFRGTPAFHFPGGRTLNKSQLRAVDKALSNDDANRIVLIHGPPGTGKTTVIAATVTSIVHSQDQQRTIWLVAQSNVAVKNIAEKLASVDFVDFKVLVSKDFHFDWQASFTAFFHYVNPPSTGMSIYTTKLKIMSFARIISLKIMLPLKDSFFNQESFCVPSACYPTRK